MKQKIESSTELSHEKVAQRAYQIWEAAGHPTDQDVQHWLQAEEELLKANGRRQADVGGADAKLAQSNTPAKHAPRPTPVVTRKNSSKGGSELLERTGQRVVHSGNR